MVSFDCVVRTWISEANMARIFSSLCLVLIFAKGMSILDLTHLFSVSAGALQDVHRLAQILAFFTILHENPHWLNM